MIADTNKFNPFIDMLNSTEWDGVPRIGNILHDYMGTAKDDYIAECMRLLLLGVISRAFSPGTKFDYVLVLVGPQGIGKSTFFKKLCCNDEWYLENLKSIYDEKKAAEAAEAARRMPGIRYVRVWLARGELSVGDDIMLVLVGGDIRPHVIDALQALVGELKEHCVTERESF